MQNGLHDHCRRVIKAIAEGRVVPLLGAGVNLCGRPPNADWRRGEHLPSGSELAAHLAERFDYPAGQAAELVRVSEYVYVTTGSGPLYESLHAIFDADYVVGPVHRFLASLPRRLKKGDEASGCQLIVTTNYDDALERAFREGGEQFDLVCYMADGEQRGKFVHWPPDGAPTLIERPNEYRQLWPDERTVILKMHGAVDRTGPEGQWDSYVITEDHYIEYLTNTDIANLVPVTLAAKLRRSHFLFLGYSMRDWNLRVILHRIWGAQKLKYKSWAIQLAPDEIDREFWELRGVDILDVPLEEYMAALEAALEEIAGQSALP